MEPFINELKENKVLRKEDIISLRNYINKTNPNANSRKKASLLSLAIYKTIDKNLEGFSDKYKQRIRQRLVRILAFDNKELIDKSDIFFTCVSLEDDSSELLDELTTWINKSVKDIIKKEVVNDYIKSDCAIAVVDLEKNKPLAMKKKIFEMFLNIKETIFKDKDRSNSFFRISVALLLIVLVITRFSTFIQGYISSNRQAYQAFTTNNTSYMDYYSLAVSVETDASLQEQYTKSSFSHIPSELKYKKIDESKLKEYLRTRNSILEDEPYFSTIIGTAKDFNLNPIVLFSITGQEQGFVPRDHTYAKKIANNPFNVFGSWQEYNSNIKDSTEIAARTVINHLKGRPEDIDPFQWINRKYAEDKNWWVGVRILFDQINATIE